MGGNLGGQGGGKEDAKGELSRVGGWLTGLRREGKERDSDPAVLS